jgi:septum formation protein
VTTLESRIYLASQSPRRRELLHQIGVRFDPILFRGSARDFAGVNEDPLPGEDVEAYVVRVARAKAEFGVQLVELRRQLSRPVLAADTTVDIDGAIIGKPTDAADAARMLARMSGRSHRVLTAVAVAHRDRHEHVLSVSEVSFRQLDPAEIRRYVAGSESLDKAGAYGIQGRAAVFVEKIVGSHSGIMGLPLCETALLLRRFGYPV